LRIGIFTESYRPVINGVATSIEVYKNELRKNGHQVYIFAPDFPGYDADDEFVIRCDSFTIPGYRDYPIAYPLPGKVLSRVKSIDLDVIHAQTPFSLGHIGFHIADRLGLPRVYTYHTLYVEYAHYAPFQRRSVRNFLMTLSRNFCNRASRVLTPSTAIKHILESYGVNRQITVLPTGIDVGFFENLHKGWARKKYGISNDAPVVLFAGRLAREKNIDFLLRAYKEVATAMPASRFLIVSGGPDEARLRGISDDLGLSSNVIFCGYLPREELAKCYADADVFMFASKTETQGLVLMESLAAGTPVVAVNAMGVTDFIKDGYNGILLNENESEFTAAVLALLSNPEERARLVANGAKAVAECSIARCTEKLIIVYEDVINHGAQRDQALYF
jgi:1,2-diacylglycerol 3-alpha-glucosyltransferase